MGLLDDQLHLIDIGKTSKEIWEHLSKLFGERAKNAKFSLKLKLFSLKMHDQTSLCNHMNNLMSLIRKLAEIGAPVDKDDSKAILLNNLSSKYNNVVFTLSQMSSLSFEDMVASLLVEEKRWNEDDLDVDFKTEIVLFSRRRMKKSQGSGECYHCHKFGHTTWNCRVCAKDIVNRKLTKSTNIDEFGDDPESNEDDRPKEESLKLF